MVSGTTRSGVEILQVTRGSGVAAIPSAAGPERLLRAGLVETMEDAGIAVRITRIGGTPGAQGEIDASFRVADGVARAAYEAVLRNWFVVVLSGSCHRGLGGVSGLPRAGRRGVVWLDCHGDFHTPATTTSGLLDGTTLASITGRAWAALCSGVTGYAPVPDHRVVLAGARALDPSERRNLEASDVTVVAAESVMDRFPSAIERLGTRTDDVYVHVDLDVLDPSVGRANAFAAGPGVTGEELLRLLDTVLSETCVRAIGLGSYDPSLDAHGAVAEVAVSIGRRIAGWIEG